MGASLVACSNPGHVQARSGVLINAQVAAAVLDDDDLDGVPGGELVLRRDRLLSEPRRPDSGIVVGRVLADRDVVVDTAGPIDGPLMQMPEKRVPSGLVAQRTPASMA